MTPAPLDERRADWGQEPTVATDTPETQYLLQECWTALCGPLSDVERQALQLRAVGFSYEEIGASLFGPGTHAEKARRLIVRFEKHIKAIVAEYRRCLPERTVHLNLKHDQRGD